jgi:hypothetical protein
MALPVPPPYTNPIPNNPFYSPLNPYVCGPYFPVALGNGIDLTTSATVPALTNDVASVLAAGSGITLSTFLGVTTITATGGGGGSTTWATLGDKTGASGPANIALGQDVAATAQGFAAIAIGAQAGNTAQDVAAIAIGASAGNANQATAAVALGAGAAITNQGACAVAVGQSAGISDQGVEALALGSQAGTTSQAAYSIVINASGVPLENTVSNTTVIKPVRDGGTSGLPVGFKQVAYNPTTGELVYYS